MVLNIKTQAFNPPPKDLTLVVYKIVFSFSLSVYISATGGASASPWLL